MRLRELYAKGLAPSDGPVALPIDSAMALHQSRPLIEALSRCLEALLYPEIVGAEQLGGLSADPSFACGLIFRVGGRDLRLRRERADASVALEVLDTGARRFVTRVQGAEGVANVLAQRLGRPPWDHFLWLHLGGGLAAEGALAADEDDLSLPPDSLSDWPAPSSLAVEILSQEETQSGESAAAESAPRLPNPLELAPPTIPAERSPEEIERLRTEYRRAVEAEQLEDRINAIRRRVVALRPKPGGVSAEVERLAEALEERPLTPVSAEEIEVLRDPEGRMRQFERRAAALRRSLEEARQQIREAESGLLSPIFLAGTGLALACTALSILAGPALRAVALSNVAWLAGSLFGVLRYLGARDRGRTAKARVASLEESLAGLEEARREYEHRLSRVQRMHGVTSAADLKALQAEQRARAEVAQEARHARRAPPRPPKGAEAEELSALEAELSELEAQREGLGEVPLASFQITQELRNLGLTPEGRALSPSQVAGGNGLPELLESTAGTAASTSSTGSWIRREAAVPPLLPLARDLDLTAGEGLDEDTRRLWGGMLSSLLGRRVARPDLSDAGVHLSDDTGLVWATLTEWERALVVESACLSLFMRSQGRAGRQPWRWILRLDPFLPFGPPVVERLDALYRRLAQRIQVAVLDSGARSDSAGGAVS